jgi:hypothetical protein
MIDIEKIMAERDMYRELLEAHGLLVPVLKEVELETDPLS